MAKHHSERAHSKFSASGAERWFHCPGSVEISEGIVDKSSIYAEEGTQAHEVLETLLIDAIGKRSFRVNPIATQLMERKNPRSMVGYAAQSADFILSVHKKYPDSDIEVENRVYLDFIHPEMFGTYDSAVIDYFGTLNVFDFKYGKGHSVSPVENLQMIFYAIGVAHKFNWNFKKVRVWIIQPRIKGYDGAVFWDIPIMDLKDYVRLFKDAVDKVENNPNLFVEGSWCHWCKAKSKCPLKTEAKVSKAKQIFSRE